MGKIADRLRAGHNGKFAHRVYKTPPSVPGNKPDKGLEGGSCNRTACQRPGAFWWNHGSHSWYCADCAHELSNDSFNKREAMETWGHDLCTLPERYATKKEMGIDE